MNDRDDRLPRIRVTENQNHMQTCSACLSKFDTRLFIECPYCAVNNVRKRRATDHLDAILPTNPLSGPEAA